MTYLRMALQNRLDAHGCSLRHYRLIERNDRLIAYFIKNLHAANPVVFSDDGMLETLAQNDARLIPTKAASHAFCL